MQPKYPLIPHHWSRTLGMHGPQANVTVEGDGVVHWNHAACCDLRVIDKAEDLVEVALEIVPVEARLLRRLKGRTVGKRRAISGSIQA